MTVDSIKIKDRTILLMDEVNEGSVKAVVEKISEINNEDQDWINNVKQLSPTLGKLSNENLVPPIKIILSTIGGTVYDGIGLYDVIKNSKTPIEIICTGKIMSMGIILLLAAKNRKSYKNTTFMIHSISSFVYGQLKTIEEDLDEDKRLNDLIFKIITDNTNIDINKLKDMYEHKQNWYMTAEEALSYGLINEII